MLLKGFIYTTDTAKIFVQIALDNISLIFLRKKKRKTKETPEKGNLCSSHSYALKITLLGWNPRKVFEKKSNKGGVGFVFAAVNTFPKFWLLVSIACKITILLLAINGRSF